MKSEEIDDSEYRELLQRADRAIATKPRARRVNEQSRVVREREFNVLLTEDESSPSFVSAVEL